MKFCIHRSLAGTGDEWYFTIVAKNGRVLATSELYKRRVDARKAITAIQAGAADADLETDL